MDNEIITELKSKSKKALFKIKKLSKEGLNRFFNYHNKEYSLLTLSLKFKYDSAFNILISKDVDVTGYNKNGITYCSPISMCYHISRTLQNKKNIRKLLLKGASLNDTCLNNKTLLNKSIREFFSQIKQLAIEYNSELEKNISKYLKFIFFILSKGIKTNYPLEFLPLNQILYSCYDLPMLKKTCHKTFILNSIKDLLTNMLYYNCNPYQKDFDNYSAVDILEEYDFKEDIQETLNVIRLDLKEIIDKKINSKLVDKVKNAFKIHSKGKSRKRVFECINYVLDNKENLQYDLYKQIRSKRYKLDRSTNQQLICSLNDITEFNKNELVFYTDPDDNKIWTFHMSEIPSIIRDGKNKWTNKTIDKQSLATMYSQLNYFPEYILSEAVVEIFDKQSTIPITIDVKLNCLSRLINTINPYINLSKDLKELPQKEIYEFFVILNNSLMLDFDIYRFKYNTKSTLLDLLYQHSIDMLRSNKININLINNIIDQIIQDYTVVKNICQILGPDLFKEFHYELSRYNLSSNMLGGQRNFEDSTFIGFSGGSLLTPKSAREIHDLISIKLSKNSNEVHTSKLVDEYWNEIQHIIKRYEL